MFIKLKKYYHKKVFYKTHGYKLDFKNLNTIDEKIHYLILKKIGKKEGLLSDKIKVKEYIRNLNIKDLYIPRTIKIYHSSKEIDINKLPNKFVLKCNHWSGNVYVCNNKDEFDLKNATKNLDNILKKKFSNIVGEYHYNYIIPHIYAEEYLDDNINKNPIDYKIYCSYGKAKSILVCSEREKQLKLSEYDLEFNEINCIKDDYKPLNKIKKPKNLNKMINIAETISKDLPFVRVDLYEINNKIYFGELTFTPAAGNCYYYNEFGQLLHGSYIDIKNYKNNFKL